MLDPVTAIGVAAAALQFLSFSLDALELCCQIRDDVDGATVANKDLESATKDIKDVVKELRSLNNSQNQSGRRINKVAAECLVSSDELIRLLEEVRGAGRSKALGAAKATFKALKANRKIEKLKNAMKERQALLDTALTHDIRNRVDTLAIEQSDGFANLNGNVQRLVTQLKNQQAASSMQSKVTEDKLISIESQSQKNEKTIINSKEEVLREFTGLRIKINDQWEDHRHRDAREELLTTLFYPEHASRRDMLKPAWQQTFDWILEEDDFAHRDRRALWSNFPKWCRESNSLYWISGKAGSGKSTLLAHILNEPTTHTKLKVWAAGGVLHMVSFFIWRPGSPLQRSVQGLLRSVLYQVLEKVPNLANEVLLQYPLLSGRVPSWSESRLRLTLEAALNASSANQCRFCFFIDGLDEYEGDAEELLQLIFSLQQHENVKCCVSSRPETALVQRLSQCDRLSLETLNFPDILQFVKGRLRTCELSSALISEFGSTITKRAMGVFLWAALTTQSVVRGVASGDHESLLRERLDNTPSDMNALFARMLETVDDVHRKSLAFYLKAMKLLRVNQSQSIDHEIGTLQDRNRPDVALLAASRPGSNPADYAAFIQTCEETQRQIIAQSRGLLNVFRDRDFFAESVWAVPQGDSDSTGYPATNTREGRQKTMSKRRFERCDWFSPDCQVRRLVYYTGAHVQWIHRSAYDFLFDRVSEQAVRLLESVADHEVANALLEGSIKLFVAFPSEAVNSLVKRYTNSIQLIAHLALEIDIALSENYQELEQLVHYCCVNEVLLVYYTPQSRQAERVIRAELGLTTTDWGHELDNSDLQERVTRVAMKLRVWMECVKMKMHQHMRAVMLKITDYDLAPLLLISLLYTKIADDTKGFDTSVPDPLSTDRVEMTMDILQVFKEQYLRQLDLNKATHEVLSNRRRPSRSHGSEIMIWHPTVLDRKSLDSWIETNVLELLQGTLDYWAQMTNRTAKDSGIEGIPSAVWSMLNSLTSCLDTWEARFQIFLGHTDEACPIILAAASRSHVRRELTLGMSEVCHARIREELGDSALDFRVYAKVPRATYRLDQERSNLLLKSSGPELYDLLGVYGGTFFPDENMERMAGLSEEDEESNEALEHALARSDPAESVKKYLGSFAMRSPDSMEED